MVIIPYAGEKTMFKSYVHGHTARNSWHLTSELTIFPADSHTLNNRNFLNLYYKFVKY